MSMTIGIVLLVLWALGLFAFHVTTGFVHVLIVLAVIVIVLHLVRGGRSIAYEPVLQCFQWLLRLIRMCRIKGTAPKDQRNP